MKNAIVGLWAVLLIIVPFGVGSQSWSMDASTWELGSPAETWPGQEDVVVLVLRSLDRQLVAYNSQGRAVAEVVDLSPNSETEATVVSLDNALVARLASLGSNGWALVVVSGNSTDNGRGLVRLIRLSLDGQVLWDRVVFGDEGDRSWYPVDNGPHGLAVASNGRSIAVYAAIAHDFAVGQGANNRRGDLYQEYSFDGRALAQSRQWFRYADVSMPQLVVGDDGDYYSQALAGVGIAVHNRSNNRGSVHQLSAELDGLGALGVVALGGRMYHFARVDGLTVEAQQFGRFGRPQGPRLRRTGVNPLRLFFAPRAQGIGVLAADPRAGLWYQGYDPLLNGLGDLERLPPLPFGPSSQPMVDDQGALIWAWTAPGSTTIDVLRFHTEP